MHSIYLDTALLAVPNYAVDHDSAQEVIDRVTHFSLLASADFPLKLFVADEIEETLGREHTYPTLESVEDFLDLMDLNYEYSARDVLRQFNTILDRAHRPAQSGISDAVEVQNFSCTPPLPGDLGPKNLEPETERVLTNVAMHDVVRGGWRFGSCLRHSHSRTYDISALVTAVSGRTSPTAANPLPTKSLVRVFSALEDLACEEEAADLWERAKTAEERYASIAFGALALLKTTGADHTVGSLKSFSIGPFFEESLADHQATGRSKFSSTTRIVCCQLVADLCARNIGKFGRPQEFRQFDGAPGWRVHLTEGELGLRLMYWTIDGSIEFANVGVKKALSIETGRKGGSRALDLSKLL